MKAHLQYLRYVVRHKWFVFLAGFKLGVPIYRLILHDWTKFLPGEWWPYVTFFYGERYEDSEVKRANGFGVILPFTADIDRRFEVAWNHHQHKNDHHWQFWIRIGDDGTELILPMSNNARREMLADWRGAGRALGKPNTLAWYLDNRQNMKMHHETRNWVEDELGVQQDFQM